MKNLATLFLVIAFPIAAFAASDTAPMNATSENTEGSVIDPNLPIKTADLNLQKVVLFNLGNNSKFTTSLTGVKIIAIDGRVTLQGIVSSQEEKTAYTTQVEKVPGVGSVDNQIQVAN